VQRFASHQADACQRLGLVVAPLLAPDRDVRGHHVDDLRVIRPSHALQARQRAVDIALGLVEVPFAKPQQPDVVEELLVSRLA
jgi:hypothetical protein